MDLGSGRAFRHLTKILGTKRFYFYCNAILWGYCGGAYIYRPIFAYFFLLRVQNLKQKKITISKNTKKKTKCAKIFLAFPSLSLYSFVVQEYSKKDIWSPKTCVPPYYHSWNILYISYFELAFRSFWGCSFRLQKNAKNFRSEPRSAFLEHAAIAGIIPYSKQHTAYTLYMLYLYNLQETKKNYR